MLSLEEPEESVAMSPLYLVFSLPFSEKVNLPLYEPEPACGLSNQDLTYELIPGDSSLPDWVLFDAEARVVDLEIDESVTFGGPAVKVQIEAKYGEVTKQIAFAVSFINESFALMELPQPDEEAPKIDETSVSVLNKSEFKLLS